MKKVSRLIWLYTSVIFVYVGALCLCACSSVSRMQDYSEKAKTAALIEVQYRNQGTIETVEITGGETRFSNFSFLDTLTNKTTQYEYADTEQWIFCITYHVDTLEDTTEGDFRILISEDWVAVEDFVYSYETVGWTSSAISTLEGAFATAVKIYGP